MVIGKEFSWFCWIPIQTNHTIPHLRIGPASLRPLPEDAVAKGGIEDANGSSTRDTQVRWNCQEQELMVVPFPYRVESPIAHCALRSLQLRNNFTFRCNSCLLYCFPARQAILHPPLLRGHAPKTQDIFFPYLCCWRKASFRPQNIELLALVF